MGECKGNSSTKPQSIVCPAGENGEQLSWRRPGEQLRGHCTAQHSTRNENFVKAKCRGKKCEIKVNISRLLATTKIKYSKQMQ